MKHSEGLEWAVHACSLLAMFPPEISVPVRLMAEFFELPEPYLAKQMQKLSQAKIVETRKGPRGGYALARPASDISLLQIVEAIDGAERHFKCTEIRRCGPSGVRASAYSRPCGIARSMWRAEAAWQQELASTSLSGLQKAAIAETPPEQAAKALAWFKEKLA